MSCSAIQMQQHVPSRQSAEPISGYQERIDWQPYTKRIDPYSIPADSYASIPDAFAKTTSMIEFQQKLTTDNPIYLQMGSVDKSDPTQSPRDFCQGEKSSINKNIQNIPSFKGETIASNNAVDKILSEALYTPSPSYPERYPLYRTDPYNPDQLGSELLEGYAVVDNIEYTSGMSIYRLFLWILLIVTLIYGAYYLYGKYSKKSATATGGDPWDSVKMVNPNNLFGPDTFAVSKKFN